MIKSYQAGDLRTVMDIWLTANLRSHNFIPAEYWRGSFALVAELLPQAEVYLYARGGVTEGFIGLDGSHIEGLFVRPEAQSMGIGKVLLDHAKAQHRQLTLHVYEKNRRAVRFYLREGFSVLAQGVDAHTGEREYEMAWQRPAP